MKTFAQEEQERARLEEGKLNDNNLLKNILTNGALVAKDAGNE